MLNQDYKEMLSTLLEEKVNFLLVGAYAMAAHGYPRATGDIDIFIQSNETNAEKDKDSGYLPAIDINKISVSLTLEKLDEKGEDQLFIQENASMDKLRSILLKFQEDIDKHPENVLLKDI